MQQHSALEGWTYGDAMQCIEVQCIELQCIEVHCNKVQCIEVQYIEVQCIEVQCSTEAHTAVLALQYNTVYFSTA